MTNAAALFDRLAEPYLVLDRELQPVAANAAWRARFGLPPSAGDQHGCRPQPDATHQALIQTVAGATCEGQSRLSPVVRLETRVHGERFSQLRNWQVFASFLPPTSADGAAVTLRYDEVTPLYLEATSLGHESSVSRTVSFEQALALAGFGVWTIDVSSGAIRCTEQCLRDLGVQNIADVTTQLLLGDSPADAASNWHALRSGEPSEFELNLTGSSASRWVLVRGDAHFSADGTMRAVIGLTIDITSRKNYEFGLDTLAKAERSERERSEAATRAMDKFIASVSHELRSPLNAIVSWAEVLQLAPKPEHVARAGEAIRRNGRQLAHMVDDLLDSGAIATGKLSVNRQPTDLGAIAAIVAEDVGKLAQQKNLRLHASDIGHCIVMADESRIKQVLWNLLANAVKFTDTGEIHLSVKAVPGYAELTVRDTGRGIDADALSMVFDRFQQILPQSSGRVGGLGLGLWLAKHIVGLHAGTIEAGSEGHGKGAVFTVRLPLAFPPASR